jgi:hypothetical protein
MGAERNVSHWPQWGGAGRNWAGRKPSLLSYSLVCSGAFLQSRVLRPLGGGRVADGSLGGGGSAADEVQRAGESFGVVLFEVFEETHRGVDGKGFCGLASAQARRLASLSKRNVLGWYKSLNCRAIRR